VDQGEMASIGVMSIIGNEIREVESHAIVGVIPAYWTHDALCFEDQQHVSTGQMIFPSLVSFTCRKWKEPKNACDRHRICFIIDEDSFEIRLHK
jgi:hypothetical protein